MSESSSQNSLNYSQPALVVPNFTSSGIALSASSQERGNPPLQLGIMASGSGTNFAAIVRAIADGRLNAVIKVLIYNKPDAGAKTKARKYQIPAVFIDCRQYTSREALDRHIVTMMQTYGVDWVIMAGWMRIVTGVLLDSFPHRVINIHPSLLPSFKGIRAIEQALQAKVKITGCTVHFVSLAVDSGEIIMQAAVPVLPDDTPETLHRRIQIQEHLILPPAIAMAANEER